MGNLVTLRAVVPSMSATPPDIPRVREHMFRGNPETLTLRAGSVDFLRTAPRTTPTDPLNGPPQNSVKITNKDSTYGLSNRLRVAVKFRVLHFANATDLGF